ncbi:MAG: RNA polymerase subunit sigma [Clostridiaceae bacterium]|nr:RNA polymerase subunit sigma [Clostridiaceae bacterium]
MEIEPLLMNNRNKFIEENKGFIYNIACKICNKKLDWLNDDELSIALISFNVACDTYDNNKGNFFGFAKVLIKNSLIDFSRKARNTPYLMFQDEEAMVNYIDNKEAIIEFEKEQETLRKAEEIAMFSKELAEYKLTLNDLIEASPSHIDTRNILLNIAFKCSKEENIINYVSNKKNLPLKEMTLLTSTNRKVLEKWRKYLLVLILIFSSNEYSYIRSYFNIEVGENHV